MKVSWICTHCGSKCVIIRENPKRSEVEMNEPNCVTYGQCLNNGNIDPDKLVKNGGLVKWEKGERK